MAIPNIRYGLNEDREYVTNYDLTSAAHELLGGIELDVASSKFANEHIEAENYFTPTDDGLNLQEPKAPGDFFYVQLLAHKSLRI